MSWRSVVALALILLVSSKLVSAQQDSAMLEAVRLASEGQGDAAKALVSERLQEASPGDSAYVEALYTAGVIAANADSAASYFRRVSIEFSRSTWADEALLQLAQLGFANGNYTAARRLTARVLSDYPFSEVRADAGFWGARSEFALGNLESGCELLRQAEAAAETRVELVNRVRFYLQRCVTRAATAADSAPEQVEASDSFFSIQVAALRSASSIDVLMRNLESEGYEPRVSRDPDGFLRVRVGRYATRAEAQRHLRRIASLFGGEPFVAEDR